MIHEPLPNTRQVRVEIFEDDLIILKGFWGVNSSQQAIQKTLKLYAQDRESVGDTELSNYQGFVSEFEPRSKVPKSVQLEIIQEYNKLQHGHKKAYAEQKAELLELSVDAIYKWVERDKKEKEKHAKN